MTTTNKQTWWVTGAGDGIGRALAIELARSGHHVIATSRKREGLDTLAAQFPGYIDVAPADVADCAQLRGALAALPGGVTELDGIILSAGICEYIDVQQLDSASIARMMQVNFLGVVHACEIALPMLQARARTSATRPQIIGIGSLSSFVGFPRAEGYGASKAAMAYFLDSLRCDVQREIDVCVVYPGFVSTRLTAANDFPMPFQWSVDQASSYIIARIGQGRRQIIFPWQLHWILRMAQRFQGFWYSAVTPRLARSARYSS